MLYEYFTYVKEVISNYFKKHYQNIKNNNNHNSVICPPYYAPFRYS